jgi:hypothetical protein
MTNASNISLEAAAQQLVTAACETVKSSTLEMHRHARDSLCTNLDLLTKGIDSLAQTLQDNAKQERLEWALNNCGIDSFDFLENEYGMNSSETLCKEIIMFFKRERGYYIDEMFVGHYNKNGEEEFKRHLSFQLHGLTGKEPRFGLSENRNAVWYN